MVSCGEGLGEGELEFFNKSSGLLAAEKNPIVNEANAKTAVASVRFGRIDKISISLAFKQLFVAIAPKWRFEVHYKIIAADVPFGADKTVLVRVLAVSAENMAAYKAHIYLTFIFFYYSTNKKIVQIFKQK